jgi:hypothetical protein
VLPDVWIQYGENPKAQLDLLLTPYQGGNSADVSAGILSRELRLSLKREQKARPQGGKSRKGAAPEVAYNQATVAVRLWFEDLVRVVLPMSVWWNERVFKKEATGKQAMPGTAMPDTSARSDAPKHDWLMQMLGVESERQFLAQALDNPAILRGTDSVSPLQESVRWRQRVTMDILWMLRCIGTIALAGEADVRQTEDVWPEFLNTPREQNPDPDSPATRERVAYYRRIVDKVAELMRGLVVDSGGRALVYSVCRNRKIKTSVWRSRVAIKADACTRVFDMNCKDISWAIIDSGIDATHPAFRKVNPASTSPEDRLYECPFDTDPKTGKPRNNTRIIATLDFTKIRDYLNPETPNKTEVGRAKLSPQDAQQLKRSLITGREIDWALLLPLIQVPHQEGKYVPPVHEHGTHVAGILGADWRKTDPDMPIEDDLRGICPDINLYDLRVLDENGEGDEFNVMAALQFGRSLNAHKDYMIVQGANLSLSTPHDVANYACGRTPICEECERLVGAGIVVVAAAGNEGYLQYLTTKGEQDGYHNISITDPGNAESVITVGSTHRDLPHTYGVSYFSSRGPTGDGRVKPDIVAPGEKIEAPVPGGEIKRKDGTSMAAPHVSGAAALLMARHRELIGQPVRIKEILCASATDLKRERYFQGAGMLDTLRALQSV